MGGTFKKHGSDNEPFATAAVPHLLGVHDDQV
jgi:hypothetical protein